MTHPRIENLTLLAAEMRRRRRVERVQVIVALALGAAYLVSLCAYLLSA
jgi:hypothetical protein